MCIKKNQIRIKENKKGSKKNQKRINKKAKSENIERNPRKSDPPQPARGRIKKKQELLVEKQGSKEGRKEARKEGEQVRKTEKQEGQGRK